MSHRTLAAAAFALCLAAPLAAQLTFDPPVTIGSNTSAVGVGDVDADGHVDILVAGNTQTWLAGPDFTTSYTLGTAPSVTTANGKVPYAGRAADVDGDGDLDWVTSNDARKSGEPGRIYLYRNPGGSAAKGTWTRDSIYAGSGRHLNDMQIVDLDGDGKLDVVVKSWDNDDRLIVAFQDSPGAWTQRTFNTGETGENTEGFAVGDLDGDGTQEIVQAGFYYSAVNWRADDPTGSPTEFATRFTGEEMKAAVADFDGDGDNDVYIVSAEGNNNEGAYWYENAGAAANFTERTIDASAGKLHMVDVIDIDFDGDIDIVAGGSFGNNVLLAYVNDGGGNFTQATLNASNGLYTGVVADLDADGDLDIVGPPNFRRDRVDYFLNVGVADPPAAPTSATAKLSSLGDEVTIDWTDVASDEAGFNLERQIGSGAWLGLVNLNADATSYTDDATQPGTTYAYRVRAFNTGGTSAYATTGSVTTWDQAGAVTISPTGGAYSTAPTITLTAAAPGDEIRYTLDGNDPTASSTLYAGAFALTSSAELRAAGFGASLQPGPIASESYIVAVGGNFPPVADAGPDDEVDALDPATLDGSGTSDLDHANAQLTFAWSQTAGPSATIADAAAEATTFTPSAFGTYSFSLTVTDPAGAIDSDEVTVEVSELDASLIAYWRFDEGSGTTAADATGDHPGTLGAGSSWTSPGIAGSALANDGVDGRVSVAPFDVIGSAMTISAWVRLASLDNAEGRLVSKASGANEQDHYWMLSQIGTTGVRFRLKTAEGGTTTLASPAGQLSAGSWVFVAATYDGATMRLYVDDTEVAAVAKTGVLNTDNSVAIGLANQPSGSGNRPLDGDLDEVKIYDRALSASELEEAYTAGLGGSLSADVVAFSAQRLAGEEAVEIEWTSLNEVGVAKWCIERSPVAGEPISELACLTARAQGGAPTEYVFVDRLPLAGAGYYRCRRRDEDGVEEVGPWVVEDGAAGVSSLRGESLAVWPNPTRGRLSLSPSADERELTLIDALGRVQASYRLGAGATSLELAAPTGLYALVEVGSGAWLRVLVE